MKYFALVFFLIYNTPISAILPEDVTPLILPSISQQKDLQDKIDKYEKWKETWQRCYAVNSSNAKKFTTVILQLLDVKLRMGFIDSLTQGNHEATHKLTHETVRVFALLTECAAHKDGLSDDVKTKLWNAFVSINGYAEGFANSSDPVILVHMADVVKTILLTLMSVEAT